MKQLQNQTRRVVFYDDQPFPPKAHEGRNKEGMYLADGVLGKARLTLGIEMGPRVALIASGGLDGWAGRGAVQPVVTSLPTWGPRDRRQIWPGFDVGMTF